MSKFLNHSSDAHKTSTLEICSQVVKPIPKWPRSKILADNEDHPSKIISDGKVLYFVTGGTVASQNAGQNNIRRIALEDGSVSDFVKGAARIPDSVLALDETYLYWSDGGSILRIPRSGGHSEVVVTRAPQPSEMLVDDQNIYWLVWGGEGSPPHPLMYASKQGGEAKQLTPPQAGTSGICIDDDSVYWMNGEGIHRVSKTGGDVTLIFANPNPKGVISGLAQDDTSFYFTLMRGGGRTAIVKWSKKGGEAVEIAPSANPTMEFVVSGNYVYYFDNERGYGSFGPVALRKVSVNGGAPETLDAGEAGWVKFIAADEKQIYFTDIARVYAIGK